jgi:hypothetical protein
MADYYPLIVKAVSGLEKSTGEARRALYDRARTALLAQLRGVEPALSEPEITRERLALEEAIRKVETEAARRSRNDPPPALPESRPDLRQPDLRQEAREESRPEVRPADPPPRVTAPPSRYDLRAPRPPVMPPEDSVEDRPGVEEMPPVVPAKPVAEPRQSEDPRARGPRGPAPGGEAPRAERPRWSPSGGPSLSDQGLKGFRDVVAETENLGSATAEAAKNVRAYQAATNAEFERFEPRVETSRTEPRADTRAEPRMEPEPARPPSRRVSPRDAQKPVAPDPIPEPGRGGQARDPNRGRGFEPPRPPVRRLEPPPGLERDEPPQADTEFDDAVNPEYAARPSASTARQEDARSRAAPLPRVVRERAPDRDSDRPSASLRSVPHGSKKISGMAVAAALLFIVAGAALWKGRDIAVMFRGTPNPDRAGDQAPQAEGRIAGKIVERAPSALGSGEGAMVAQKVVLYEEDQSNPNGAQFVGSAVWRTETAAPAPGQKPDVVVRAEIEIPQQKVSVRWSLRRNDDKQLPASHTVEIVFTLPPDFAHGGISNIPGVLMKQGETTRGIPLNGVAVKVTTNFFLIGLSSVDADMQRNIQLLKERSWFDIPVVYGDGKRAIIAIEKGTPGERAFAEAFAAWGQ